MKIVDLLMKLDTSEANEDKWVDINSLAERHFDIYNLPYTDEHEIKVYWLGKHLCTDTNVGYRVYYFRDQRVAVSCQPARKSDEVFYWVGIDEYKLVYQYLLSLVETPEIEILNLDEEMPNMYSLSNAPTPWHIK